VEYVNGFDLLHLNSLKGKVEWI